ncbi:hypothetical protein CH298_13235 [Rhodococcoides fascians]|uniref:hypothetical protein n=1 Tax=Rhodococcoides fascians TaxID=1828 RepID=UPI000B9AFE27|nr:hypothetical protein [Rhodococcus fascians]OZE89943.1 hypothetical protein CH303_13115 [Rhodococcus fascians]OZF18250.1 hypothetical protein CH298_13235 [Rhodococcus fascians]OZF21701.1 hypothetical protein CH297_13130 [Rhodococcus fascians]OZF67326.1 hypothetical protein CH308_13030 [Rhodococcus fascians]
MKSDGRGAITGGDRFILAPLPQTEPTTRGLVDRTHVTLRQWEQLEGPVRQTARSAMLMDLEDRTSKADAKLELDQRTSERAKSLPSAGLDTLSDLGFAWRDVAALMGVSVAAVNKWRKGEGITGPNRLKLAKLLALLDMLEVRLVAEPASWLEMPIHEGVSVSPIDLLTANRYDLVLEYANHTTGAGDYQAILDEFNPNWREDSVDETFETFVDSEGIVAIRPKAAS